MICQVYSATSPEEAVELVDAGVNFVGIFPVDTPQYSGVFAGSVGSEVSHETADLIFEAIEGRATKVVLSLSNDAEEIPRQRVASDLTFCTCVDAHLRLTRGSKRNSKGGRARPN